MAACRDATEKPLFVMEHMLLEGRISVPPHRIAGHARVYVAFDTLVRVLTEAGHDVRYVRNFTGRIITGSRDNMCQSGCLMNLRCMLNWYCHAGQTTLLAAPCTRH